MKSMNNRNKQRGFFAVGLGLALTAVFSVVATSIETATRGQPVVEQTVVKVPDLADHNLGE